MNTQQDPLIGCLYQTIDGVIYYVLSKTYLNANFKIKYIVLNVQNVPLRYQDEILDVGEIGEWVGPFNIKWTDKKINL